MRTYMHVAMFSANPLSLEGTRPNPPTTTHTYHTPHTPLVYPKRNQCTLHSVNITPHTIDTTHRERYHRQK